MPDGNGEIVRRYLDQARNDPDAVWDIFAEDVEWETNELASPDFPAEARGPDAVREFFRRWIGAFEGWDYEVEELMEGPGTVAVKIHQWGHGKGSGVRVENHFWQIWTMRDGKAVRVTHKIARRDALGAAGLSE
jgi:ketosteroid isomerase-like protein